MKLFKKHSLYTGYKIRWTGGPLNCYQRSELLKELCDKIVKHSYILGEHFLKIDTDKNSWRSDFDETIYLLHRINCSLWRYTLGYHAKNCRDCCIYKMSLRTLDLDSFQCHKLIAVGDIYLDSELMPYDQYNFNDLYIVENSGDNDSIFCVL